MANSASSSPDKVVPDIDRHTYNRTCQWIVRLPTNAKPGDAPRTEDLEDAEHFITDGNLQYYEIFNDYVL